MTMDESVRGQGVVVRPYGFWALCLSLALIVGATTLSFLGAAWLLQRAAAHMPAVALFVHDISAALDDRSDLIATAFFEIVIVAFVLLAARWRGGRAWRRLIGWMPWSILRAGWRYWGWLAATIAYGIAASVAVSTFYPQARDWDRTPEHPLPMAVFLVLAVLMAPVAEELLFRGWIFTALRSRRSAFAAIVLSAAAFAAPHGNGAPLYALAVFPVGLVLGRVRERTGSIKATMLLHAGYNAALMGLGFLAG